MKSNTVTVSLAAALAVAALVACGDSQTDQFVPADAGAVKTEATPKDAGGSPPVTDIPVVATSDPPSDSDAGSAPVEETDLFTGAAAFGSVQSTVDSETKHLGFKNTGRDCFSCHGTIPFAPKFAFAGTVPNTPNAEVRVVGPDGTEIGLVATDPEGNFWLPSDTPLPTGSKVGLRTASAKQVMAETISVGSCNQTSCHDGNRPLTVQ